MVVGTDVQFVDGFDFSLLEWEEMMARIPKGVERNVLPAGLTISRVTSTNNPEGEAWISIEDKTSGIEFARVKLSLKQFAAAILGLGCVDSEVEVIGLEKVGWKAENKTETIKVPQYDNFEKSRGYARAAVRELEVDGWAAREGDVDNHHNWKGNTVSVVFFRHVKP